ncbi:MAG: DUF3040 domain-containing protein [Propionibacteriaceae bacterium]
MPLTPQEQQALDELEMQLTQSDPKLVDSFRGVPTVLVDRKRLFFSLLGVLLGVAILVIGIAIAPSLKAGGLLLVLLLGVTGFAVMLAAVLSAMRSWTQVTGEDVAGPKKSAAGRKDKL